MAEYLIYNRDYETSYKKGDIIEVREDGYWTNNHGFNKDAFLLLCISQQEKNDLYDVPLFYETGSVKDKRRYNISTTNLTFIDGICRENNFKKIELVERIIVDVNTTRYIRSGAEAGGDGLNWETAFNTIPETLTRGFTYYVSTGIYGAKIFDDAVDGVTTITIKKATEIDHGIDTGWDAAYGTGQAIFQELDGTSFTSVFEFRTGYYIIDGVIDGYTDYGFKIYTDTSEIDYLIGIVDFTWQETVINNIELRRCEIEHKGCDNTTGGGRGFQVHSQASFSGGLLKNCYIHDIPGIPIYFYNTTNTIVEDCSIVRNHSDAIEHAEGIQSGGNSNNNIIRNNRWEDIEGTAIIVGQENWKVYGNVFYYTANYPNIGQSGDGLGMGVYHSQFGGNMIVHNTAYNLKGNNNAIDCVDAENNLVFNNIFVSCERIRFTACVPDYNYFYNNEDELDYTPPGDNNQIGISNIFTDIETNNFHPLIQTDIGVELAKEYMTDKDDITRINRTLGAYEYREAI